MSSCFFIFLAHPCTDLYITVESFCYSCSWILFSLLLLPFQISSCPCCLLLHVYAKLRYIEPKEMEYDHARVHNWFLHATNNVINLISPCGQLTPEKKINATFSLNKDNGVYCTKEVLISDYNQEPTVLVVTQRKVTFLQTSLGSASTCVITKIV